MAVAEASVGDAREFARIKGKHDQAINTGMSARAERPASDDRTLPRHIDDILNDDGTGYLAFTDRTQDFPVVRLNGPWTFGLQDAKQRLVAGHKTTLELGAGTRGLGACPFPFALEPNTVPADDDPVGEFAFPPGDAVLPRG
jgi:hypothetical protein